MKALGAWHSGYGLAGLGVAAGLALLALLALPRGERWLARSSFVLLALHVAARLVEQSGPTGAFATRVTSFVATFSLFASMARSAFLLLLRSSLARRFLRPWPRILRDLVQGFLYFVVALLALRAVGVEPGSLLTTSALLTAVVGLSLQDTLGNLFAGLALQAQPPFSVGDWIQFAEGPDGVGRIVELNWRATHLVTVREVEVIVPNAVMAKSPLKNFSRPTRLVRRDAGIVVPDRVPPERVRAILLRALENTPQVLGVPLPTVTVGEIDERGTHYAVRYFIENFSERDPIESDVRQRIWYALRRDGIDAPAPRRRVETAGPLLGLAPAAASAETGATERRSELARVEFLTGVGDEALDRITAGSRLALFTPGEVIIRQGDTGDELFVLLRGSVDVLIGKDGYQTRVAALEAGQFFGEAALLRGEQRSATVVATTECELLVIAAHAFRGAAELDPTIESRVTGKLAARLAELSKAVSPPEPDDPLDDDRRSDILIARIKQFFTR